jgi:hypothetical protein
MSATVRQGTFEHLWCKPAACAEWLSGVLRQDGVEVALAYRDPGCVILDVRFAPPPPEHLNNYPDERVRVNVLADGQVGAVPVTPKTRPWCHRYPYMTPNDVIQRGHEELTWASLTGPLCLDYPLDPPHLRWQWDDGLDMYVRIIQRHLWTEEYWRRYNDWPVEDAPHGERTDGQSHPILTPELRCA